MWTCIKRAVPALAAVLAAGAAAETAGERLVRAYPAFLAGVSDGHVVWRDGTRMPLSDGVAGKSFEEMLARPDLDDMFALPYPAGAPSLPPTDDPGRVRNFAFFAKMYGDCREGAVTGRLKPVAWMPKHGGGTLMVTAVNGADQKLAAAVAELETLPPAMIRSFLVPSAGTYNCRPIAGTDRPSAHGFGIAIDISLRYSDYWRWRPGGAYRNRIPAEIVAIFERHGFIWGGKWKSFDTMHFEYRPELLPR
jgi:hypothetical protein